MEMSKSNSNPSNEAKIEEVDAVEKIDLEEAESPDSIEDIDIEIDEEFVVGPDTY